MLEESIAALETIGTSWELIVVDNCSTDSTLSIANSFAEKDARVRTIAHERNQLYSGSCRSGMLAARGEYVGIMDSDGQFFAEDLAVMRQRLQEGASIVFGFRAVRHDPLSRKVFSFVFNTLARIYIRSHVRDLNVGIRMFDRRFIREAVITHKLNMVNPELYVRARNANLPIAEVPVKHAERTGGASCHQPGKMLKTFIAVNRYLFALSRERGRSAAELQGSVTTQNSGESLRKSA